MLTYPILPSTLTGNATIAQVLAFLKSPSLLARRFAEIIAAQNFIAHYLLTGRYKVEGGAIAYYPDEAIKTDEGPETIAPGGEYPLVALSADQAQLIAAMKKGFGSRVTDEEVGRTKMDPVERVIAILANTMVDTFDSLATAAVASAVNSTFGGGSWSSAATIVANVEGAKAALIEQKKGYKATSVVMTTTQYAAIAAPLLSILPREQGNPVMAGTWPNILGLEWVANENLPAGWVPTVVDRNNLGGIGHEDIPSPEYVGLGVANGSNVEVARYRKENDSTLIQIRKSDVPVVRNPDAAVEITGTGL